MPQILGLYKMSCGASKENSWLSQSHRRSQTERELLCLHTVVLAEPTQPGLHFRVNLPTFGVFNFLFNFFFFKSQTQKSQRKHFALGFNLIKNCFTPLSYALSQMKDLFDFLALQTALIKLLPCLTSLSSAIVLSLDARNY